MLLLQDYFKIAIPCSQQNIPPDKNDFDDFPSKDASLCFWSCFWSSYTLFCHASSDTICSKDKNIESYNSFPTFWGKNEIYYSLLLFICHYSLLLFTPKFCLFKGGCPLYFKQVFSLRTSSF